MEFTDVQKASLLSSEKTAVQRAIQILTAGGRITSMTVFSDTPTEPPQPPVFAGGTTFATSNSATVQTSYITYPPQMVDAIVSAFQTRLQQINDELGNLGITGMEQA